MHLHVISSSVSPLSWRGQVIYLQGPDKASNLSKFRWQVKGGVRMQTQKECSISKTHRPSVNPEGCKWLITQTILSKKGNALTYLTKKHESAGSSTAKSRSSNDAIRSLLLLLINGHLSLTCVHLDSYLREHKMTVLWSHRQGASPGSTTELAGNFKQVA